VEKSDRHILVILALLFAVRLFHITEPPIEVSHNWRQTTSLMVARNFYQNDHNILYPSLDENGEKAGYVAMEFPLLSYSIYLASSVFGYDHWYGRLINLFVVTLGGWFFYRLMRLYFDDRLALISTLVYSCSSLFHLARKVLPDPMSLSLIITGVYFGTMYLRSGKWSNLVLYLLFASAGALVKIPYGLYLVLLVFPFFSGQLITARKITFSLVSALVLFVVYWWYFNWNYHLSELSGIWYNSGKSISMGIQELIDNSRDVFARFYFSIFQGFILFGLSIAGLLLAAYKKQKKILLLVLVISPLFVVYMMKSGFLFAHHGYYALVLMPVFSLFAAHLLQNIPVKLGYVLLSVGLIESIANQQHDFFVKDIDRKKMQLETIADQLGPRSDLVALICGENPNEFYFLNRKGWMIQAPKANQNFLADIKKRGCRYLFVRNEIGHLEFEYHKIFENHEYIVFEL